MIGVYTDIKVAIVLAGLRTRYVIPNLAVSDTFTASTSLERHLTGLDFSAKLLNTEVIHGINDLVTFLGGTGDLEGDSEIVAADSFSRYQTYFQDRQNVLAHSTEKLQEYELLTQPRSLKVYETIRRANTALIVWGTLALFATLFFTFTGAFGWTDLTAAAITGGLTLASFVGVFFTRPSADLQRNLTNLAVFKMILESHSLKTALARFHLTTPQALRELETEPEAKAAGRQVEALRAELGAFADVDGADFAALARLGFGPDAEDAEAAAADGANGSRTGRPTATAHQSRSPGTRPLRTAATPDDRRRALPSRRPLAWTRGRGRRRTPLAAPQALVAHRALGRPGHALGPAAHVGGGDRAGALLVRRLDRAAARRPGAAARARPARSPRTTRAAPRASS